MLVEDSGEQQPALRLEDGAEHRRARRCGVEDDLPRGPGPAVMTPPARVQVQVAPGWLRTLAEAPEAPTGTESGAVMTGATGVC